jgi:hypothetical protein
VNFIPFAVNIIPSVAKTPAFNARDATAKAKSKNCFSRGEVLLFSFSFEEGILRRLTGEACHLAVDSRTRERRSSVFLF